jgi:hypothetical protein
MSADPIERRVAKLEGGVGQMNRRLGSIERRLDSMESRLDAGFRWVIGLIVASWISTTGTLVAVIFQVAPHLK